MTVNACRLNECTEVQNPWCIRLRKMLEGLWFCNRAEEIPQNFTPLLVSCVICKRNKLTTSELLARTKRQTNPITVPSLRMHAEGYYNTNSQSLSNTFAVG